MNKIPLKILIPYRAISVVFGFVTLWNILAALSFSSVGSRRLFVFALIYIAYAIVSGTLAYGFWKMKKWVVFVLGGAAIVVIILNIINIINGTQKISQAIIGIAILCALFVFTYFSRKFLDGEYKNFKALGLSLFFLIFTQVATFFLE